MLSLHWVASKKYKRAQEDRNQPGEERNHQCLNLDILTGVWNFIRAFLFALNIVIAGFFVALLWGNVLASAQDPAAAAAAAAPPPVPPPQEAAAVAAPAGRPAAPVSDVANDGASKPASEDGEKSGGSLMAKIASAVTVARAVANSTSRG